MKALTVDVKNSTGRVLCCTVFRSGGKKLLAKGHVISDEDIRILESEGMDKIWVTELEDGEIGEDDAVSTGRSPPQLCPPACPHPSRRSPHRSRS